MSLKDRVQDVSYLWPEVRWPVANVICEGPSIEDFDPSALLLGPTVAVNRAIAIEAARPDFWATSDDPRALWGWSEPYRKPGLRYFSTDQNAHIWVEMLPDFNLFYSVHMTPMGRDDNGMLVILPTILPVLAWLMRLGVKRVRVFGADMRGMGTPLIGDWKHDPDRDWKSRWAVERVLFAHMARTARERGARIERWRPARTSPSATALRRRSKASSS